MTSSEPAQVEALQLPVTLVAALVVGGGLAALARVGATPLLVGVAVAQAILAVVWAFGTAMPGRKGALVLAAMAAAGADVTASVWPHGRLGTLLAVLVLAVPVMFVHQLVRGAARVRIVSSLGAEALLIFAEIALAGYLQLRHEFGGALGGHVAAMAVAAVGGALVVGCLVDLLFPAPRFDPAVPRGLLALIASAGLGCSLGYLMLRHQPEFVTGRAAFVGAALGALAGLLAVAGAFVVHTAPAPAALGKRVRPMIAGVLPIAVLAPVAFLLCLAIRS